MLSVTRTVALGCSLAVTLSIGCANHSSEDPVVTRGAVVCDENDPTAPCHVGHWGAVEDWPIVPIHANLLPTGLVIAWDRMDFSVNAVHPHLFDPQTGGIFPTEDPGRDVFCAGHTLLADGRLFTAGGHIEDFWGLDMGHMFNPWTGRWYPIPSGERMNAGRWYPTNTLLPSGDVLVTSGLIDSPRHMNQLPQVFEVATNSWRDLTTAGRLLPMYPRMHVVADGRVFYAGPSPDTGFLDTSGTGAWAPFSRTSTGLMRDYGSSVQYAEGKILIAGGGGVSGAPPTNTVELLNLNEASSAWRVAAPMAFGRRHHNATLLPDGTVLVTGGTSGEGDNNAEGAVHEAEIWDPVTETWTTMARAERPRLYHSIALLLPDGRVLTGASGHPSADEADSEFNIEMFSPPYLYRGDRPVVTEAPKQASLGDTLSIGTPDAQSITAVNLLRPGAVTHAQDQSQGINRLSFTTTDSGLSVQLPDNGNVLLPGYHMLFVINDDGVPSVASWIKIGDASPPMDGPPNETVDPNRPRAETVDYTFGFSGSLEAKIVNLGEDEKIATYIKVSEPRNRYYGQWLVDSEELREQTAGTVDENGIYRKQFLWEPHKDVIGSIVLVRYKGDIADLPHEIGHVDEAQIVARCSPFHTEANELATDIVEDHDDDHVHVRRARCVHRPAVRRLQFSWNDGGALTAEVDDLRDDYGLAVYIKKNGAYTGQWAQDSVADTVGRLQGTVFAKPAPLSGPPAGDAELILYRYEKGTDPELSPVKLLSDDIAARCPLSDGVPIGDNCERVERLIPPTPVPRIEFTWDNGGSLEADVPELPDNQEVAVYLKTDAFYGQWDPVNLEATIGVRAGAIYSKAPLHEPASGVPARLILYRYPAGTTPPLVASTLDPFRVLASCQVWPVVESPCREIGVAPDLSPELEFVLGMRGLSGLVRSGVGTSTSHLEVNALGVIALVDGGLVDEAEIILNAINDFQFPDGSFPNAFDGSTYPATPLQFRTRSPNDPPGQQFYRDRDAYRGPVNSGNNAYYLMALAAWSRVTGSDKYLDVMRSLADYLVNLAQRDDDTLGTYGGIVSQPTAEAGSGHRHVFLAKQQAKTYAALRQLAFVLREHDDPPTADHYEARAQLIRDFVFRELFDPAGYFYTATRDDSDANASPLPAERDFPSLDAQTLSILAFRDADTPLSFAENYAMTHFFGRTGIVNGNEVTGATWFRGDSGVWLEGTAELGVVLAVGGDATGSQTVFDAMTKAEEDGGGFQTFSEGYVVNSAIGESPDRETTAQIVNTYWRIFHATKLNPFANSALSCEPSDCNDGDPCTIDTCEFTGCVNRRDRTACEPRVVAQVNMWGAAHTKRIQRQGDHLFALSHRTLKIFDVGDNGTATQPVAVGRFESSDPRDLMVVGNYAYLIGYHGLEVVDVSDPTQPVSVATRPIGFMTSGTIVGHRLYALGYDRLSIVNIEEPTDPVVVGSSSDFTPGGESIEVVGNYAFVTSAGGVLEVLDVSGASPMRVRSVDVGDWAGGLDVAGNFAYVGNHKNRRGELVVVAIDDPRQARVVGRLDLRRVSVGSWGITSRNWGVTGVTVSGATAYAQVWEQGDNLFAIDVSDPTQPELIREQRRSGSGGVDMLVEGSIVYVTAGNSGIDIFETASLELVSRIESVQARSLAYAAPYLYYGDGSTTQEVSAGILGGLRVFDVSNPKQPELATMTGAYGRTYGMATDGESLAITHNSGGMSVVNLQSDPFGESPAHLPAGVLNAATFLDDDHLLVLRYRHRLETVSIADPTMPQIVSTYENRHRVFGQGALVHHGGFAYIANYTLPFHVFDVRNPRDVRPRGQLSLGRSPQTAVQVKGSTAWVGQQDGNVTILDVADPDNPSIVATLDVADRSVRGIGFTADRAIVVDANGGATIYDITDPRAPIKVIRLALAHAAGSVTVGDGHAYVGLQDSALVVIDGM